MQQVPVEGDGDGFSLANDYRRRLAYLPSEDTGDALLVSDLMTFNATGANFCSWLLHTHGDNRIEIEGDRVTLTGGRQGNHCLIQIATPRPGRWKAEPFLDHTRLRYDFSYNPHQALVVFGAEQSDSATAPLTGR